MQLETFFHPAHRSTPECEEALKIALELRRALDEEPARSLLVAGNQPRAASHAIQKALLPAATALGFSSEVRGLFKGAVAGLRPDCYRRLGDSGILLEVERGKTTTNNMGVFGKLCG